jgi:hypothetical protein
MCALYKYILSTDSNVAPGPPGGTPPLRMANYALTFVTGGLLIAGIQVLIDHGLGVWAAILATMPVKDMMVVLFAKREETEQVLNDMLKADFAVVCGTLGIMLTHKLDSAASRTMLAVSGMLVWVLAAAGLLLAGRRVRG